MGGPAGMHYPGQQAFDFTPGFHPAFIVVEQDADALGLAVLGAGGGNPDYLARNRQLGGVFHEGKKHEYFIPQLVVPVGGNKNAAIFQVGHIGRVEGGLGIDVQGQNAGAGGTAGSGFRVVHGFLRGVGTPLDRQT